MSTRRDVTSRLAAALRRRGRRTAAAVVAVAIAVGWVVLPAGDGGPDRPPRAPAAADPAPSVDLTDPPAGHDDEEVPDLPVSVEVDDAVVPTVAAVPGLRPGDPDRPVGAMVDEDGHEAELVLREVVVSTPSADVLAAFLDRWGGELVDTLPGDGPGDHDDHLVRIDPTTSPVDRLDDDLATLEPFHAGVIRVSNDEMLAVLSIVLHETRHHGTELSLNWLGPDTGIEDGTSTEAAYGNQTNAFRWTHIASATTQDIGVDAALQLLHHHGRLDERVRMLIYDRGFNPNADFPTVRKIRNASWSEASTGSCGGNPCPWHGTQVVIAAMGQLDNGWGAMGPAGPVAELVAAKRKDEFYANLRYLHELVREERPQVVNMSHGYSFYAARAATEDIADRRYRSMVLDHGALLVAAAGNNGRNLDRRRCLGATCWERELVLPCESRHVLCVGGMEWDETERADESNYGTRAGRRTVELYGPFRVVGLAEPGRSQLNAADRISGTSYAAPFVAGVAALVLAADPSLSPAQVRGLLLGTAHQGGLGPDVAGNRARINAAKAVAVALGVEQGPPTLTIRTPEAGEYGPQTWFEFDGVATDWTGTRLPIEWSSDQLGPLGGGPSLEAVHRPTLPEGRHLVTATARDRWGREVTAQVQVDVVKRPPELTLEFPADGAERSAASTLDLGATTHDHDLNGPLPDGAVRWEVRDSSGTLRRSATGHVARVPGGTLPPGSYEVTVLATAGGQEASDRVRIVLREPDPDDAYATILAPDPGLQLGTEGGPVPVTLRGTAATGAGEELPGTRLRWTADAGDGEVVLCTGSDFLTGAGGDGPALKAAIDCGEVEAALSLLAPAVRTTWTVRLEVRDAQGRTDARETKLELFLVVK